MSSSPFKLPSWDDVKEERRRQRGQHGVAGESSIDLSTTSSAGVDVAGVVSKYRGKMAPSDFERLRDSDLFLDTHSQASLHAHFPRPSPTRGQPYVGRYDRYLMSTIGDGEDKKELGVEIETKSEGVEFTAGVNHVRPTAASKRRDDVNERGINLQNVSDEDDNSSIQGDVYAESVLNQRMESGEGLRQDPFRKKLDQKQDGLPSENDAKAFAETISRVESLHNDRLISQFEDLLGCLQRLSQSIDSTSEIGRCDLQLLQDLPSLWKSSFEKWFPDDVVKKACFTLEKIAMLDMNDLNLAANDKNNECFQKVMTSIKSCEKSLSSLPLAIARVFDLTINSFESHKKTYLSEIKSIQEMAKISTSEVIQAERARAVQMMKQVELKYEKQKKKIHEEHR